MGFFNKKAKAQDLLATGSRGVGTVLLVQDTGTTINNNPRIKMTFRVEPLDGGPAFDLKKTKTVSRVEIPRQGERYPVWYDAENPDSWAYATIADDSGREMLRQQFGAKAEGMVGMGAPAAPPPAASQGQDTVAALATLADLHKQGLLTNEQFEQQRDKLLGS